MIYHASILSVHVVGNTNTINHAPVATEANSKDEALGMAYRVGNKLYKGQIHVVINGTFADDNYIVTSENIETTTLQKGEKHDYN